MTSLEIDSENLPKKFFFISPLSFLSDLFNKKEKS
jgi:hypothetical protein|tara:strand:+ start:480 stop:584 length:105 start_codon:yes stop_codon:yes gene_type:complete